MPEIKYAKDKDGYSYEYKLICKDNKTRKVFKSGFKTLKQAQEAAEKSYVARSKQFHSIENPPIKQTNKYKINKFQCTEKLKEFLVYLTVGGVGTSCFILASDKMLKEFKEKFLNTSYIFSQNIDEIPHVITVDDCDFTNLHVVIRSAKSSTYNTIKVISDQLNRLGLSNEIINKDTNYIDKINSVLDEYQSSNIVFINIESGVESEDHVTIFNDTSNINTYPCDVLTSCINTSCEEYNLNPVICSGIATGHGWRLETSIEKNLFNNNLNNKITQLTIDLPTNIDNETMRNNAASAIVEGLMRYTYLPKEDRFDDIYYCARYGDTISSVSKKYNISSSFVYENSNYNRNRPITVGDTLTIGEEPISAGYNYMVKNPLVTSDVNIIESIYIPYVVKENDTLSKIANIYNVRIEDIIISSSNINNIRVGETIFIPQFNYYLTSEKQNKNLKK